MILVLRSAPGTERARAGIRVAAESVADIVLRGPEAARHARRDGLRGFCGTAFVLAADLEATGLAQSECDSGLKIVNEAEMARILSDPEGVKGEY